MTNQIIINLSAAEAALSQEELHILSVLANKVQLFEVEQIEKLTSDQTPINILTSILSEIKEDTIMKMREEAIMEMKQKQEREEARRNAQQLGSEMSEIIKAVSEKFGIPLDKIKLVKVDQDPMF